MTRSIRVEALELWEAMLATPFPYCLLDPSTHTYIDGNREYADLLGIAHEEFKGYSVLSLYDEEGSERLRYINASFSSGMIQRAEGRVQMRRPSGVLFEAKGWARRIIGLSDHPLVVGSAVEASSTVEPDDFPWVRRAPRVFGLTELSEDNPAGTADRANQLEQHLWRIALEVRAAGLLATESQALPIDLTGEVGELSVRQREIVAKLMAGKRVTEIAREMHLSPSTIRNHLSVVYRRFGVHSQVELISQLRTANDH